MAINVEKRQSVEDLNQGFDDAEKLCWRICVGRDFLMF
jgi:hypothetical protein